MWHSWVFRSSFSIFPSEAWCCCYPQAYNCNSSQFIGVAGETFFLPSCSLWVSLTIYWHPQKRETHLHFQLVVLDFTQSQVPLILQWKWSYRLVHPSVGNSHGSRPLGGSLCWFWRKSMQPSPNCAKLFLCSYQDRPAFLYNKVQTMKK